MARDLLLLQRKFVIIRDLLSLLDILSRVNYNLFQPVHTNNLCVASRITTMVDESSQVADLCRVEDRVLVEAEEVGAADAHFLIDLFAVVGDLA
jgi:hypothetical protein